MHVFYQVGHKVVEFVWNKVYVPQDVVVTCYGLSR